MVINQGFYLGASTEGHGKGRALLGFPPYNRPAPQAWPHTDFIFTYISSCDSSLALGAGRVGDEAGETIFVHEQIIFSACSLLDNVVFSLILLLHRQHSASP